MKIKEIGNMSLIPVVVVMTVVGGSMWLMNIFIIKDDKVKLILNFMIIIVTSIWILQSFGILVGHINVMHKQVNDQC